jgi:hypothetical protein
MGDPHVVEDGAAGGLWTVQVYIALDVEQSQIILSGTQ